GPGLDLDPRAIVVHGGAASRGGSCGPQDASPSGSTLTTPPPQPLVTCTVPAARAYSVSSSPIPTPAPGLKRVPRWRTMISPPVTVWPANVLTPSRCALEAGPVPLEPSPFLCAIVCLRGRWLF